MIFPESSTIGSFSLFEFFFCWTWRISVTVAWKYSHWLFHDGGPYHIVTSSLICSANQWIVYYMIGTSVMKELIPAFFTISLTHLESVSFWVSLISLRCVTNIFFVIFIVDVLYLRVRYSLSVVTGYKFTLFLHATNLISMPRCDGLECFCSSTGMNVCKFSSISIYCIKNDIIVFIRKLFIRGNRITSFWDTILSDNVSLHPRLTLYNTLFMSEV